MSSPLPKCRQFTSRHPGMSDTLDVDAERGTSKHLIFVSGRKPEAIIEQDLQRRGLKVEWANSIKAAKDLLASTSERTAIVTDLALADSNWTDLVEQVRSISCSIPIVLVSSTITAELWWNALDCDVEDILLAPLLASRLCEVFGHAAGL